MKPFAILLSAIVPLLALSSCGSKPESNALPVYATAIPVKVITLHAEDLAQISSASGTVTAKTTSVLSSQIMAKIVSVSAHEGDHVQAGQTLIVLNAQELDARYASATAARDQASHAIEAADLEIAQAQASLDLAQLTHKRLQELFDKRSLSNQELDESTARMKAAQAGYAVAQAHREELNSRSQQMAAEVHSAQISRGYSSIAAPFSGVVVSRNAEPGVMAAPGVPLITIEREGNYRLEASVEDSRLASIQRGQRIPVQIDALNQQIEGTVTEISPVADAQAHSAIVKLDLPSTKGLRSGMFGQALFPGAHERALSIPVDAITEHGQLESVLVADSGFARSRLITTGIKSGTLIVVLSGLNDGDQLIYPLTAKVADGMPLEVQK